MADKWASISYWLRTLNVGFSLEHMATSTTVGLKSAGRLVDRQLMATCWMYFEWSLILQSPHQEAMY